MLPGRVVEHEANKEVLTKCHSFFYPIVQPNHEMDCLLFG